MKACIRFRTAGFTLLVASSALLALLPLACDTEHGGDEDANMPEAVITPTNQGTGNSDAAAENKDDRPEEGILPERVIGSESEFRDAFDEVIRDYGELAALYKSHNLRSDAGVKRPDWGSVDFGQELVIYISLGRIVGSDRGDYYVESIENTGEEIVVTTKELADPWGAIDLSITNHPGQVVVTLDYGHPVTFRRLVVDLAGWGVSTKPMDLKQTASGFDGQ